MTRHARLTPSTGKPVSIAYHIKELLMKLHHATKLTLGAIALAGTLVHAQVAAQSVAVTSIVEHPALDSIKDGVLETLTSAGYTEDKGFEWQFQTAQGNTAIAAQIAR